MRAAASILLVLGGAALLPASTAAQGAPGIDLRINPRIGLYEPLTDLTDVTSPVDGVTTAKLEGSLALGLGVELDLSVLPIGLRANLDYGTGSEVRLDEQGFASETGVETTVLAVVGDVVFRPIPRILVFSPYLFAGGGLKQYDFESFSSGLAELRNESDPTIHFGGGLDIGAGAFSLNAEVSDYMSWWKAGDAEDDESDIQHDLFITLGFSIGLL